MKIGEITGFGERPRRNVEVRIGRRELFSEISEPPGILSSRDVIGIRVSEELSESGKHVIHLHLNTKGKKSIRFYTAAAKLDIALLLDELEAALGQIPRNWEPLKSSVRREPASPTRQAATDKQSQWKRIEESKVYYQLTGESVVQAIVMPDPPRATKPAIIRVTHQNSIGRVDSDVFIRLGNLRAPLNCDNFDTVSDWKKAPVVEDLLDDGNGGWTLRKKASGAGVPWSGTYEVKMHFPKGKHLIEIKIVSRVPEVCSIVLSNWKVTAK